MKPLHQLVEVRGQLDAQLHLLTLGQYYCFKLMTNSDQIILEDLKKIKIKVIHLNFTKYTHCNEVNSLE